MTLPDTLRGELATTKSAMQILLDVFWVGPNTIFNPDRVLRYESRGREILLYQDMEDRDARIRSCLQTRKSAVLSLPMEIVPGGKSKKDFKIAEFCRSSLFDNLEDLKQDLWELLDAVAKGFSVSEVIWDIRDGMIAPTAIKSRPQARFHYDLEGGLRLLDDTNMMDGYAVPERKFIVFSFQPQNENLYGTSVLRSVYWPYWFKKNVVKFWLLFTERFGGIVHGSYPSDKGEDFKNQLLSDMSKLAGYQAFVYPDWATITLESSSRGDAAARAYDLLTAFCNREISQGILGQAASTEGTPGKLGNENLQESVLETIVQGDATALMGVINFQLIRWITDLNFVLPAGSRYPMLKIHYETPEDLRAEAERDKTLVADIGLPIGHKWLYQKYNTPEPAPEEITAGLVTKKAEKQTLKTESGKEKGVEEEDGS